MKSFFFGKFAGVPLSEIPEDYLHWIRQTLDPPYTGVAEAELLRRGIVLTESFCKDELWEYRPTRAM